MAELYSFRRCPYAIRARLAILLSGIEVVLREIHLRDKAQTFLKLSPKATVPVLVEGELLLDESIAIMEWTLNKIPWCEKSKIDYDIIHYNDRIFKSHLDAYKYPESPKSAEENRSQALIFLQRINERLSKNNYLHGEYLGFEDAAILPFVRQFANVDRAWFDKIAWSEIKAWLTTFETSSLFSAAMVKFPKWKTFQPPLTFPLRENCKLDAYKTKNLLYYLCTTLGLCIPPSAIQSLVNAPPQNIDLFLIRVFNAEGLTHSSELYRSARGEVVSFLSA